MPHPRSSRKRSKKGKRSCRKSFRYRASIQQLNEYNNLHSNLLDLQETLEKTLENLEKQYIVVLTSGTGYEHIHNIESEIEGLKIEINDIRQKAEGIMGMIEKMVPNSESEM